MVKHKNQGHSNCQKKNFKVYGSHDSFHIGSDSKLYFTDAFNSLSDDNGNGIEEFCVDKHNSRSGFEYDYIYPEELDYLEYDYSNDTDFYGCNHESKPLGFNLEVIYCASNIIYVNKCCNDDEMINLK